LRSEVATLLRDDTGARVNDESGAAVDAVGQGAGLAASAVAAGRTARPANGKGAGKKLTAKRSR